MGKISGTLTDESKIYIIDEETNVLESALVHPVGNYSVDSLAQSSKFIISVRTSDKKSLSFANVIPEVTASPMYFKSGVVGDELTYSQGNTHILRNTPVNSGWWAASYSEYTFPESGKYYIEFDSINLDWTIIGVSTAILPSIGFDGYYPHRPETYCYYDYGYIYPGSSSAIQTPFSFRPSLCLQMGVDRDNNQIRFGDDNVWASPVALPTGNLYLFAALWSIGTTMRVNCGQRAFNYAPPTGFTAGVSA